MPDAHCRTGTCVECGGVVTTTKRTAPVPLRCSDDCRKIAARRSSARRAAYIREWHANNPERVAEIKRSWIERNPAKRAESSAQYTKRNRMKASENTRRYRALKRQGYVSPFTPEQLAERLSMFPGCWICGATDLPLEVDHVKPVAVGGLHVLSNLRPACRGCNARKGARWPFTVAGAIGVA